MRRAVRRLAESGGGASGTAFLAGLAVGAVLVVAVGLLLSSEAAIVRAAAVVPLIVALLMVGVAMAVGVSGASVARAEPAAVVPESAEDGRTDGDEGPADAVAAAGDRARAGEVTGSHMAPATAPDAVAPGATLAPADGRAPADLSDPLESADASDQRNPGDRPDTGDRPNAGDALDPPDPREPSDAPPLPPDPPPGEPVTPTSVVEAWAHYRRNGDGFFTARGLQRQFGALGVAARVRDGLDVGAGGDVLVVEADPPDPDRFFVVPSFVKSPGAAPEWFEDAGDGALSARTQTIHKLAEGKWTDSSFAVVEKGSIS